MDRWAKGVLLVFAMFVALAAIAVFLGERPLARYLIVPATVLSTWAFLGHLVTLDDDAEGGFFNPTDSRSVWRQSLLELGLKAIAFFVVGVATLWLWE